MCLSLRTAAVSGVLKRLGGVFEVRGPGTDWAIVRVGVMSLQSVASFHRNVEVDTILGGGAEEDLVFTPMDVSLDEDAHKAMDFHREPIKKQNSAAPQYWHSSEATSRYQACH